MSAVIPQAQSFAGNTRSRTAAAAQRLAEPPDLSPEAARRDKIDNDEFERQAAMYLKPDLKRPALVAADEVESMRTGYKTGAGRLNVLVAVTNKRLDYYNETHGGGAPFDPISAGDRAKCEAYFAKHGQRLADQPRVAPPNPLKPKPGAETLIEKSKVNLTAPVAAQPAAAPSAATNAALDKAIVEAESARPADSGQGLATPARVTESAGLLLPPPATLTIEFVSVHGFHCELTLHAPSGVAVLTQGEAAMKKLIEQKAKAPAAESRAAAGALAGESSETPVCAIHHTPMEKRQKKDGTGSFWSCARKLDDGSWCPYKPPK